MAKWCSPAGHRPGTPSHAARRRRLDDAAIDALVAELGLPCFVKPANMGSSVGVSKARSLRAARRDRTRPLLRRVVVVEEAIIGSEIRSPCSAAPLTHVPPTASVPGEIVERVLLLRRQVRHRRLQLAVPADLTAEQAAEVKALAVRCSRRCADGWRVDFCTRSGFLCNEINTMPGFTSDLDVPRLWQAAACRIGTDRSPRRPGDRALAAAAATSTADRKPLDVCSRGTPKLPDVSTTGSGVSGTGGRRRPVSQLARAGAARRRPVANRRRAASPDRRRFRAPRH